VVHCVTVGIGCVKPCARAHMHAHVYVYVVGIETGYSLRKGAIKQQHILDKIILALGGKLTWGHCVEPTHPGFPSAPAPSARNMLLLHCLHLEETAPSEIVCEQVKQLSCELSPSTLQLQERLNTVSSTTCLFLQVICLMHFPLTRKRFAGQLVQTTCVSAPTRTGALALAPRVHWSHLPMLSGQTQPGSLCRKID